MKFRLCENLQAKHFTSQNILIYGILYIAHVHMYVVRQYAFVIVDEELDIKISKANSIIIPKEDKSISIDKWKGGGQNLNTPDSH